jgi:hypothetical protein
METKHTPAPWWVEVDTLAIGCDVWPRILSENYEVVGSEGMFGNLEIDMANASLIASAPELLEALKKLLHIVEQDLVDTDICFRAMEQAERAIAKAEGE